MARVLNLNSVADTGLWKELEKRAAGPEKSLVRSVMTGVESLCQEASDRMKAMAGFHREFTLHDERHLLRVTELMGIVLGENIAGLNPVEIGLLILGAHFHDQGMVVDADRLDPIRGEAEFKVFRDTWAVEHPNLHEIEQHLQGGGLSDEERDTIRGQQAELEDAALAAYIRERHGRLSEGYVRQEYQQDKRFDIAGGNIVDLLARLCASHTQSAEEVMSFHCDEMVGTWPANLRYLSVILRLADILDFDRDRTPDVLYRTIHFTNDVSVREWEKHRGVRGWQIGPEAIRFDMQFDHPVYERAAREFIDQMDDELVSVHEIVRSMPAEFAGTYKLELPQRVDRSRIGPRDNQYVYHDLEFSLSRDEIVKLLMMDNLYKSPSLCIRELLQNSLDALRYRQALMKAGGVAWEKGKVEFEHKLDDNGYEVVSCRDNGVGMDEEVITKFLTNAGRSYYRSPRFEQERIRFREKDVDFDPCSQFGIGFMSCFMLGDQIRIETRRDYGPGREWGKPWVVEINGIVGMLILRPGRPEQEIGTAIKIRARDRLRFIDTFTDKVQLIKAIKGYAVAVEFPVVARCDVPKIQGYELFHPELVCHATLLEKAGLSRTVSFQAAFSAIDTRLSGYARETFLADRDGLPTYENDEAWMKETDSGGYWQFVRRKGDGTVERMFLAGRSIEQVCLDGILVAGAPGKGEEVETRYYMDKTVFGLGCTYVLDIRGNLKPKITPARTAPFADMSYSVWEEPTWDNVAMLASQGVGQLWGRIVELLSEGLSHETFWKISMPYHKALFHVPSKQLWKHLAVPIVGCEGVTCWQNLDNVGCIYPKIAREEEEESFRFNLQLFTVNGGEIMIGREHRHDPVVQVHMLIVAMSTLEYDGGKVTLKLHAPTDPECAPSVFELPNPWYRNFAYAIPYGGVLGDAICAEVGLDTVNRNHALARKALEAKTLETLDSVQEFAKAFVLGLARQLNLRYLHYRTSLVAPWMKHCAYLYSGIDWRSVHKGLRAPYKVWLEGQGIVEITDDDFRRWAKADVVD